jgi:hexosaminidase
MHRLTFQLFLVLAAMLIFCAPISRADGNRPTLPVMPLPSKVQTGTGDFVIDGGFKIENSGYAEPRMLRAQQRFLKALSSETGILFRPQPADSKSHFFIQTTGASNPVQQLGEDESYTLVVTAQDVHLQAPNPLGILHGLQSFLQLVHTAAPGAVVDAVTIEDQPRFPWRGLMIDVGRHFIPADVIKLNLDGMEAVKLNVFHWHLSEDQGFRLESKRFPLLQKKGSDGLYYTQTEIREIVEYAHDRGIRVVPEFDMPGHSQSWFAGYPELASGSGPYPLEREWGIFDPAMDPAGDRTYEFLDELIGEVITLFPDAYFHMGGDECNGKEWDRNPRIQAFMHQHNLKDNSALQAYFAAKVQTLIAKHGRIGEGWDEVLLPGTPKDVVIQSWRGPDSLAQAAREGYRGILSAGYYIDLNYHAEDHYMTDPLGGSAATLTSGQQKNILGGEATMWSEYISPENVNGRIWPRTAAIAERLWSPQDVRDVPDMYRRLDQISTHLKHYGIDTAATEEKMLARMAGPNALKPLQMLAGAVEPPKGYDREGLAHYTAFTPLNRLIDAIPPESMAARHFKLLIEAIIESRESRRAVDAQTEEAHNMLTSWENSANYIHGVTAKSALMSDLSAVSASVRDTAQIGLSALDWTPLTTDAKAKDIAFLEAAGKPQGVLLNVLAPIVEELVNQCRFSNAPPARVEASVNVYRCRRSVRPVHHLNHDSSQWFGRVVKLRIQQNR